MRGYLLLLRVGGIGGLIRYESARRRRERFYGRRFDPQRDGLDLLRYIGATPAQITEARKRGLA